MVLELPLIGYTTNYLACITQHSKAWKQLFLLVSLFSCLKVCKWRAWVAIFYLTIG